MGVAGAQPIRCALTVLDYGPYFASLKYFVYLLQSLSYMYCTRLAECQSHETIEQCSRSRSLQQPTQPQPAHAE